METFELDDGGRPLAVFSLEDRPVEIGRALGCDIVVDDAKLAPRQWWLARRGGTVVVHDLTLGRRGRSQGRHVRVGGTCSLGQGYRLRRLSATRAAAVEAQGEKGVPDPLTARLPRTVGNQGVSVASRLRVLVGEREPRAYRIDARPVQIGRARDNDVVLVDANVSAYHCRLEPVGGGLLVRDLGSRNGTYVRGVRVERAILGRGAVMRVGATDLRVVEDGSEISGSGMGLLSASPRMTAVLDETRRLAPLPWPILIHGESGTGKEGLATALHRLSERRDGPLVTLNAGGIAPELVESELFGHERGAFTGAAQVHRGVFEQADGGTLFFDELGELPLALQARLLRVLETGEVRRVGAERTRAVRVRLVCATHRDLRARVAEGAFREDLYYRVARLVLEVPPLRARPEDIPLLAAHFLASVGEEVGHRELGDDALERLHGHTWPGNVRELRKVVCAAAASCAGPLLTAADVELALRRVGGTGEASPSLDDIRRVVAAHGGNLSAAARSLGIPRSTLRGRLRTAP